VASPQPIVDQSNRSWEGVELTRTHDLGFLRSFLLSLAALLLAAGSLFGDTNERTVTKLADGVFAIEHKNMNGGNVNGNTTVIIGDREVFVVDSCYLPPIAREDIAQIRKWMNKPVGYLLNTHFYNDHNNGNKAYLDAFPSLAIVAQVETKKDMDLIQPGNIERGPKQMAQTIAALQEGKTPGGRTLTEDEKKQVQDMSPGLEQQEEELKTMVYQSPTLTFSDRLDIDLGNREVQVMYLGRGNTAGDAIVYLPKERILAAGDLLVHPIPYTYDGYPVEWAQTLQRMAQLDVATIVPGHGPVFHDKAYLSLVTNLLNSAVDQVRARIRQLGFPGSHSVNDIRGSVDLTSFRTKFAGDDKDLQAEFDDMTEYLVKITFSEAAQR
jgi:glyoxylase-like metal-dependent hydrolase (beta-lactamase superfamily II)